MENSEKITLGQVMGSSLIDEYESFNLTEVQQVLSKLSYDQVIDDASALLLAQQALHCGNILIEFIAKLTKTVGVLESKINNQKNKTALAYKTSDGRTTADMKKQAGESDAEVLRLQEMLARAKGAKTVVEYKYEILIKAHHHFKDLAAGHKKLNGVSFNPPNKDNGWG